MPSLYTCVQVCICYKLTGLSSRHQSTVAPSLNKAYACLYGVNTMRLRQVLPVHALLMSKRNLCTQCGNSHGGDSKSQQNRVRSFLHVPSRASATYAHNAVRRMAEIRRDARTPVGRASVLCCARATTAGVPAAAAAVIVATRCSPKPSVSGVRGHNTSDSIGATHRKICQGISRSTLEQRSIQEAHLRLEPSGAILAVLENQSFFRDDHTLRLLNDRLRNRKMTWR